MSPVLGVSRQVIGLTPTGLRERVIGRVGTADKPLLIGAVVGGVLLLGLLAGLVARASLRRGLLVTVLVTASSAPGAVGTAGADPGLTLLILSAAAAAAGVVLVLLLPGGRPRPGAALGLSRRAFMLRGGGVLAAGAALAALGARTGGARARDVAQLRRRIRLPRATSRVLPPPADALVPGAGHAPLLTPAASFYRVDIALRTPQVDVRRWSLRVGGLTREELRLSYDDLLGLPHTEAYVTVGCVGNPVGGTLIGTARWQGVLLADLLRHAGPRAQATQVVGRSVDGYTGAFPLPLALDGRAALVAVAMDGEPLPVEHGFPARLIVPGLYGYESAVKWLSSISLADDTFTAYWVGKGYARSAPFRTSSRIDAPDAGATLAAGPVTVAGLAWAPHRGVAGVEVRADDGPWRAAVLAPGGLGIDAWRAWSWTWPATTGTHVLAVRALDIGGQLQDGQRRPVLPTARLATTRSPSPVE